MKKVRIKTWEEMLGVGKFNGCDITPPEASLNTFVTSMEALLPEDRIIEMQNNKWDGWTINDWMIDPTYPDAIDDHSEAHGEAYKKFMKEEVHKIATEDSVTFNPDIDTDTVNFESPVVYKVPDGKGGLRDATEDEAREIQRNCSDMFVSNAMPDIKDIEEFMDTNDVKTIYKVPDDKGGFRDATEAEICAIESEYVKDDVYVIESEYDEGSGTIYDYDAGENPDDINFAEGKSHKITLKDDVYVIESEYDEEPKKLQSEYEWKKERYNVLAEAALDTVKLVEMDELKNWLEENKPKPEENWQICTKENTNIGDEVLFLMSRVPAVVDFIHRETDKCCVWIPSSKRTYSDLSLDSFVIDINRGDS